MKKSFLLTRVGMAIAILSGFGFIVLYAVSDQLFRLIDGVFWAKMLIVLIIIINAYLLHKHKIGLYWGSAFSFISWWSAMILGTFSSNGIKFFPSNPFLSFIIFMIIYAFLVILGAAVLHKIRKRGITK